MDDLISRQEAKVAMRKLKKWYVVGEEHKQKNIGVKYDDVMFTLDKLPSAQPEHLVKESGNLVKGLVNDCISRQDAIDAAKHAWAKGLEPSQYIEDLPSVQTEQQELITWLLDEIWDDDAWELNYGAFPEILCRKLVKLGYVAEEGGTYVRIDAINGMPDCPNGYSDTYDKKPIIAVFEDVPSAQPEIIRCKDCKNSEHWYRDRRRCFLWNEDGVSVFDDGFCNYAERRQEADSSGNMSGTHKNSNSTETHSCVDNRTETHESCTDCPLYDHDRHNCPRFNKVIPTAILDAQPRWIPVTEALPDRGKTVLITNDKGNVRSGRFRGVELWKDDGVAYWTFKGNTVEHVLAWMPLPEPYKGGTE